MQKLVVEIENWNCYLFMQLSPASTPVEYRFQRGLLFTTGIEIEGRVIAPEIYGGLPSRLWIKTSGPGDCDRGSVSDLGVMEERESSGGVELWGMLELPGELSMAATCLGTIWKYVSVHVGDEGGHNLSVTSFAFSRMPPHL